MGLAACASALLLSVTNHLTQNVAAIPFLWVLPLSLYLLSFILCFDSDRWYRRWLFAGLGAVALARRWPMRFPNESDITDLSPAVAIFCAALFILFMVCHGELARRRPAPAYLTSFYLMVSVGGRVGGLFIGFAAPYLFNALYDLPVVVSVTASLLVYLLWRETETPMQRRSTRLCSLRSSTACVGAGCWSMRARVRCRGRGAIRVPIFWVRPGGTRYFRNRRLIAAVSDLARMRLDGRPALLLRHCRGPGGRRHRLSGARYWNLSNMPACWRAISTAR